MPKILVAGATGQLGRHVVRGLLDRGAEVRVLTRDAARAAALGASDVHVADALKRGALTGACEGVDAVFSCLGASVALKLGAGRRGYPKVDVPANLALLEEARRAGTRGFVYTAARVVPETAALPYFAAHETVARAVLDFGGHVLRPTAFFSALGAFVDMARRGPLPVFGDGTARSNPIDDRDLAAVAVRTILDGGPREQDLGGPEVLTRREMAELAFAALGKPPKIRTMRPWLASYARVVLWPISPRLSQLVGFAAAVSLRDIEAPAVGTRRLGDYLRERAGSR